MSLCTYGHIQKGAHERAEIPLQRRSLHDHEADSATRIYPPTSDDAPLETAGPTRCSNGANFLLDARCIAHSHERMAVIATTVYLKNQDEFLG